MSGCRWISAMLLGSALLVGCASAGDEAYFRPEQGWALCRAPMPVEMASFAGTRAPWTADQRTDIAAAIGLALALRCIESDAVARQAAGHRGITAINNPEANQVSVYPGSGRLVFEVPAYADYRTSEFLDDLENGISCGLAPGEVADPDFCLPD